MKGLLDNLKSPRTILFLTFLWLIIIFLLNPHLIYTTSIMEEWFATKGLIFYKDFVMFHAPLSRMIFIPIHLISNWNFVIDPFVGLALGLGNLFLIYLFGKRFLSTIGTTISLIFFSIIFWYTATGILYFHEILVGYLLTWIIFLNFQMYKTKKIAQFNIFILGALIALTLLTGQIATLTLFTVGIFSLLIIWKRKLSETSPLKTIFIFFLGITIPISLLSSYFLLNNAFGEFFHNNVTHYFDEYNGYGRNFSLLPIKQLLIFYSPAIVLLIFTIISWLKKRVIAWQYLYILLLSISSIPFIIFSVYHPHHLNYALPILALSAGFSFDYLNSQKTLVAKIIFSSGVLIFIYVATIEILPWHIARIVFPPSFKITNDLHPDDYNSLSETVFWLKTNTEPKEKLIVTGTPLVYLKSDRLSSINLSFGLPHTWLPLSKPKKQIQASPPDYWVIDQVFIKRLLRDYKTPEIVELINQQLSTYYKLEYENADWKIWKKNSQKNCN